MKLYKTSKGNLLQSDGGIYFLNEDWNSIINRQNLFDYLSRQMLNSKAIADDEFNNLITNYIQPPISTQEVWAAGVTYLRSRDARMEEAKSSGGGDFYDKVYYAERPEIFFKASPHRVVGHGKEVFIRKDSTWNVPEPELTLYINSFGEIQAYTIGNDMSSRSIEGENPLYLPQAKMYEKSTALGPCLFVPQHPISQDTLISIAIKRDGKLMYSDSIQLNRMKRKLTELVSFLYRECEFPDGCFLMTGTGMVPSSDFTLHPRDEIEIMIEGIGALTNTVAISTT